jgi:hypothetical protein
MSFINVVSKGTTYAPGYFLANGDENVIRETREASADSALVVTSEDGTKHIPMGTAYPTNDGNAEGILYEDVDVTNGDMPCSVITKNAVVYEDRLAITGESYDAVTPETGDNPAEKGWYERSGSAGSYIYTLSTDTTVGEGKTYYAKSYVRLASAAKTALQALGFKFIATAPAVTRPY